MEQLGDIRGIRGDEVSSVDCIIGGSPCQDLSVAGQREGLSGKRSGLFMEQMRIVREMRSKYGKPRFMVWENVPGVFSSNEGEDFKAVLEEIIRIAEPQAPNVPLPPKGKWPLADCWYGDGWSLAYRVLDAQFWGVPQRRRRIALVADFGGQAAPEILFERRCMSGDIEQSEKERESDTARDESCIGAEQNKEHTSKRMESHSENQHRLDFFDHDRRQGKLSEPLDIAPTVVRKYVEGGLNTPLVMARHGRDAYVQSKVASTIKARDYKGASDLVVEPIVRRLTPLECERLQGYPDGYTDIGAWTDTKGKLHKESSDTARYKALGNSIALPPWRWVLKRLCGFLGSHATMGSLFSGIGGFDFLWTEINGDNTVLWESEIEEFPIAVSERRMELEG